MRKTVIIAILLAVGGLYCGCAVNPVTGEEEFMLVPSSQDLEIGRKYAPEVEKELGGRIDNAGIQNYVNSIGQRIAQVSHTPNLEFHYAAVNDKGINAVALPGGYVFVTKGMLEQLATEAQLASVLAHETVHVTARHSAAAISQQIGVDILLSAAISDKTPQGAVEAAQIGTQLAHLGYSREHEYQADGYALDYLVKAGYTPYAMIEMMEILERQNTARPFEFFSTHPNPANRREKLQRKINRMGYYGIEGLAAGEDDYKKYVLANLGG